MQFSKQNKKALKIGDIDLLDASKDKLKTTE